MSSTNEADNRTLTLKKSLSAPIKLVWEVWTQPEHIVSWWGPKGMETKIIKHEFKVGGEWKYIMMMPDGNEFVAEGTYTEIEEQKLIVSKADFRPMTEGVEIKAEFEEKGDKTEFTFSVIHPTAEYCQQQEKMGLLNGWGSVFDRLEELLLSMIN